MQNGFNVKAEALARAKFPPLKHDRGFETRPFIVVDKAGEIGLWHLPSVISKRLQSMVEKATSELHQKAPTLFKVGNGPATRCDPSLFRTSAANMWGHGTACLCYCWFQQAHDVSALPVLPWTFLMIPGCCRRKARPIQHLHQTSAGDSGIP